MDSTVPKSAVRPKPPGGSRKGRPNKVTADLRAMVLGSLAKVGGEKYLIEQAKTNATAYLTLVGKCMPKELTGLGGKDLFPFQKVIEEYVKP